MPTMHDLIVVGAGPTGLSLAIEARRSGLSTVRILEPSHAATPAAAVGRHRLDVQFGMQVERIDALGSGGAVVETSEHAASAGLVVVVDRPRFSPLPIEIPVSLAHRVHTGHKTGLDVAGQDVLVVGEGDDLVDKVVACVEGRARGVVVDVTGRSSAMSPLARSTLLELEHDRRITIFWRSDLAQIVDTDGYPMAYWDDRMTPALQFDHVISMIPDHDSVTDDDPQGPVIRVRSTAPVGHPLGPALAWQTIRSANTRTLGPLRDVPAPVGGPEARRIDELRLAHYNAEITHFDHSHEDLWVIRVRPDRQDSTHRAGQYATLGLGYWEPRVDDADEGLDEAKRTSMIRRSYSISSRILDDAGYLVDPHDQDEIEFYIVHVRPGEGRIPALTPRLAAKRVGDRIYLGPKVAGRYTLAPVVDPTCDVVFLATGTGEAPHNAMVAELLRKGHAGRIVSVVSVRHLRDLGYLETNRRLEERFPNFRYLALPTREPTVEKRYVQDVIRSGELADLLPHRLDPERTHVFLCGNPAMIGMPERGSDEFPPDGAVAALMDLGFTADRRGDPGNVHSEEYW